MPPRNSSNEQGQAIAEFVIIAMTLLFVLLGVIQFALILNAYNLVKYAAYNAARAAIVTGADEEKMKEAARLSLLATFPSHGRADTTLGLMENYEGAKLTDSLPTFFGDPITKVEVLHKDGVGCGQPVTFDDPVDTESSIITVRVTHYYEMVVPFANRLLFFVYNQIRNQGGYGGQDVNQVAAVADGARRPGGQFFDIEYRLPLTAYYTMRMQSDFIAPGCARPGSAP